MAAAFTLILAMLVAMATGNVLPATDQDEVDLAQPQLEPSEPAEAIEQNERLFLMVTRTAYNVSTVSSTVFYTCVTSITTGTTCTGRRRRFAFAPSITAEKEANSAVPALEPSVEAHQHLIVEDKYPQPLAEEASPAQSDDPMSGEEEELELLEEASEDSSARQLLSTTTTSTVTSTSTITNYATTYPITALCSFAGITLPPACG